MLLEKLEARVINRRKKDVVECAVLILERIDQTAPKMISEGVEKGSWMGGY